MTIVSIPRAVRIVFLAWCVALVGPSALAEPMLLAQADTAGRTGDCASARGTAERVVCENPDLAAMDRTLAGLFRAGVAARPDLRGRIIRDQREWRAARAACGEDEACLDARYSERIAALRSIAGVDAPPPPDAAPDTGPTAGSTATADRATIADVQRALARMGYRPGPADGAIGARTRSAIAQFQRREGLAVTGAPTPETVARLLGEPRDAATAGAGPGPGRAPGSPPVYADFIHMALMSDTEAYLADAGRTGIDYIRATGTESECRALFDAQREDEFARRAVIERASGLAREVIAALPDRPRRIEIPVEVEYGFSDYDFDRQGFPIRNGMGRNEILAAGTISLATGERPVFCRTSWGYPEDFGDVSVQGDVFDDLRAEHGGVAGIDLLPMPPDRARAFRAENDRILLRATLVVEPRAQGRGPLKGTITALGAVDPSSGEIVHVWDVGSVGQPVAAEGDPALAGDLLAALVAPVVEPMIDRDGLDGAATRYFRYHERAIDAGNPPPGSPLPLEAMRGVQPEIIAARNRDALRAVLRGASPPLPLTAVIEKTYNVFFDEDRGITFNTYETELQTDDGEPVLSELALSTRDRPVYPNLVTKDRSGDAAKSGFTTAVVKDQPFRIQLELDRILRLRPVAMDIEAAAARGLVGQDFNKRPDRMIVRFAVTVDDLRAEDNTVVIGATLGEVSYRWASDGSVVAAFPAADFPTVAGLREAAEAALPPIASASDVQTPAPGARFGAEMADLLVLRYQPDRVDDKVLKRMMLTRFAYEVAKDEPAPDWGRFFRDVSADLTFEDLDARVAEFRTWSQARAAALPEYVTIQLPLAVHEGRLLAPFERRGRASALRACEQESGNGPADEQSIARGKICEYLQAAWRAPEPVLFRNGENLGTSYSRDLRHDCYEDRYCSGMYNARVAFKLPRGTDVVVVDRLPVIADELRGLEGDYRVELDVEPTGVSVEETWPRSPWEAAIEAARAFGKPLGVSDLGGSFDESGEPVVVFTATVRAARLVDATSGSVVADLPLAGIPAPPADLLRMPDGKVAGYDILGIRLGMSFAEADALIRAHMEVGKVLTADRTRQISLVSGAIEPYTSGRIYASATGDELIAILDEPPAAAETVVGAWRIVRLPKGEATPAGLQSALTERYGPPSEIGEVGLPFMQTGLAFHWWDVKNPYCAPIDFSYQTDLWQDESGAFWLPPFMTRPYFPLLRLGDFVGNKGQAVDDASLCPAHLGVRFASYDGKNHDQPAGDEIVTWLSDNRSYARHYVESLAAPAGATVEDAAAPPKVKF